MQSVILPASTCHIISGNSAKNKEAFAYTMIFLSARCCMRELFLFFII